MIDLYIACAKFSHEFQTKINDGLGDAQEGMVEVGLMEIHAMYEKHFLDPLSPIYIAPLLQLQMSARGDAQCMAAVISGAAHDMFHFVEAVTQKENANPS